MDKVHQALKSIAKSYADQLEARITDRVTEMEGDDTSHFLIYRALGVTDEEGRLIDIYQNKGRFLYRYAGSFLEASAKLCFSHKYPSSSSTRIPNTIGRRPKTFEIDFLINNQTAVEIKWRDATTDGDHITKEHTRIQAISDAGYKPVRVMFYYPNRAQAIKIQQTIETLYKAVDGKYYYGESAWAYIYDTTGIDLKDHLERIAKEHSGS